MKKKILLFTTIILIGSSVSFAQHFSFTARGGLGSSMYGTWPLKYTNSTTGDITKYVQTPNGLTLTKLIPRKNSRYMNMFGIPVVYKKGNNGVCFCENKSGFRQIGATMNLDWDTWGIASGLFIGQRFVQEFYYTEIQDMYQYREDISTQSVGIPIIFKVGNMWDHIYFYGGMVFYQNLGLNVTQYIAGQEYYEFVENSESVAPKFTHFIFGGNMSFFFFEMSFASNKLFESNYIDPNGIQPYSNYKKMIFSLNYGLSIPIDYRFWDDILF